ncbi:uncharacterized protein LOC130356074 isoform X2 [Hyla sarda]|uniref:uncharacterized protein LOC130356074 isoform X2 n=1 Tax=Hyla sarda TaxID=327740 RepID=UPI0024C364F8|nr:uncharacterized protein LOC130356074 isoform X2 [Hyla sarda]
MTRDESGSVSGKRKKKARNSENPSDVTEEPTDGNVMGSSTDTIMTESADINGTMTETCHLFNCMGDHCYTNESLNKDSKNVTCSTYCALFRHNSSYFASMCDPHCRHHLCNDSAQDNCTIRCCTALGCSVDNGNEGNQTNNTTMPSTEVMSTASTTTTTTTLVYSEKKCRSFKCDGSDCFKTQTTAQTKQCQVGINHCELQKIVKNGAISYEAGCSNTCSTSTKSCAAITTADCFQECCNATNAGCCMKLDGQVRFNTAPLGQKGSILKLFTWAFFIIFVSRFISSS